MAKQSKVIANERRKQTVARYAPVRAEYKAIIADAGASDAERAQARRKLQALPRDASPTRVRNRDAIDGRPRGFIGKAGVSRVRFRELAHRGELPGIHKSSW
ncbi:30S ribosomal protein S14 [Gordonia crocea]|uniref:Small ribosomal subunit protein uS14 n=1 Tax=Gordonia crocea TaxID=589162 RepID=A0A7M3SUV4_9ACTN|nr:30S ribosomal protein S14 [Gordonia crocea]GED96428.1 30S ribosomal protein S14 [Gordonia crocea]